jgi:hypothetical protein
MLGVTFSGGFALRGGRETNIKILEVSKQHVTHLKLLGGLVSHNP